MSVNSNVWTVEEARAGIDDLLKASRERGPQNIRDGERTYVLTMVEAKSSPVGKNLLQKGGPLIGDGRDA